MDRPNKLALWVAVLLIMPWCLSVSCSDSASPAAEPAELTHSNQAASAQEQEAAARATEQPVQRRDVESEADTVIIDLRIWQDIERPLSLWLAARPIGEHDETLEMEPLDNVELTSSHLPESRFAYAMIVVAGAGLRIYQQVLDPARIYVAICVEPCDNPSVSTLAKRQEADPFRPLGKTLLLLDDGEDAAAGRRFGDLRIAAPRGNPGLQSDRMHLLALRDVFDADPPLDWSVATPTADWEGVTVSGSPARVTGLELSNRNLRGEIWGYLGDLVELRRLRMDGNQLTGVVPTKLQFLRQLKLLRLRGNQLGGCVPPGLWSVQQHDLADTGLEQCPPLLPDRRRLDLEYFIAHIAWGDSGSEDFLAVVVDVPYHQVAVESTGPEEGSYCEIEGELADVFQAVACGLARGLAVRQPTAVYIFWDWDTGLEIERSHYSGCIYDCAGIQSPAAWLERLAASQWVTVARWDRQAGLALSEWP